MSSKLPAAAIAVVIAAPAAAQLSFVDVTAESGLHFVGEYGPTFDFSVLGWPVTDMFEMLQRNMGNGAAVGDYDNDGDFDVYLLGQLGHPNILYRNDRVATLASRRPRATTWSTSTGSPARARDALRFTDVTDDAGVGDTGMSRAAAFVDLDNDGWQDLVLVNDSMEEEGAPTSAIYRNNADGTFTDVTSGSGFAPWGLLKGGLGVTDYDGDGLLDLYVTVWTAGGGAGVPIFPGHNRLYRNDGGFRFTDVTVEAGLGIIERDSFTPIFADFDRDGDPDLYVTVDHTWDLYYRNDGGVFVDQALVVGATHNGNDMGAAPGDFDGDGDLDIFCTNITDPDNGFGTGQFNTLLVNQFAQVGQVGFVDDAMTRGVADTRWGWGAEFFDADDDGDLDLFAVNGYDEFVLFHEPDNTNLVDIPADLFVNDGAGNLLRAANTGAETVGDSRAAIAFDFDRDGDRDLLVTNVQGPAVLLDNRTAGGHWLDVKLIGGGGVNRDAVGAIIEITAGGQEQFREIIGGGSYLSGRPFEAHFGLGAATTVDQIVVTWPGGAQTVLTGGAVDRRLVIELSP